MGWADPSCIGWSEYRTTNTAWAQVRLSRIGTVRLCLEALDMLSCSYSPCLESYLCRASLCSGGVAARRQTRRVRRLSAGKVSNRASPGGAEVVKCQARRGGVGFRIFATWSRLSPPICQGFSPPVCQDFTSVNLNPPPPLTSTMAQSLHNGTTTRQPKQPLAVNSHGPGPGHR